MLIMLIDHFPLNYLNACCECVTGQSSLAWGQLYGVRTGHAAPITHKADRMDG